MDRPAPAWPIALGCPVWGCGKWSGEVYPPRTPRRDWLKWYSRTFNAVEGNSTFYATPKTSVTRRWAGEVADGFRFALKFPSEITHHRQLVNAGEPTAEFLRAIEPLAEAGRLGPTFLQLSPQFGPDRLRVLSRFLHLLPRDLPWAVELRHHGWFDGGDSEHRVNELLTRHRIDKVLLDSRSVFESPPQGEAEEEARRRKPATPVRQTVIGKHPILRFIGRDRLELADRFLDQWVPIVARWVTDGLDPFVFMHTPDDAHAPELARRFANRLQGELPEHELAVPMPPKPASQLSWFD